MQKGQAKLSRTTSTLPPLIFGVPNPTNVQLFQHRVKWQKVRKQIYPHWTGRAVCMHCLKRQRTECFTLEWRNQCWRKEDHTYQLCKGTSLILGCSGLCRSKIPAARGLWLSVFLLGHSKTFRKLRPTFISCVFKISFEHNHIFKAAVTHVSEHRKYSLNLEYLLVLCYCLWAHLKNLCHLPPYISVIQKTK